MAALMYKSAFLYNFIVKMLHGGYEEYKLIGNMIEGKKVLDLACGTGILTKYLGSDVNYEGWDLNNKFIKYALKKGLNVQKKNVFDIAREERSWDTIIVKDLLHHIYPKEKELLSLVRGKTKYLIVCEPILDKKRTKDKLFGSNIFDFVHYLFGDFDAINHFNAGRDFQANYDRTKLLDTLEQFGKNADQKQSREMIIIKLKI